jgi:hypothetical protein
MMKPINVPRYEPPTFTCQRALAELGIRATDGRLKIVEDAASR